MMNTSTYIINKNQIEKTFGMADYIASVEKAFDLYGRGQVQMPPKVYLNFPKGDLRCMPVYIPALNIAGVKNVNVHPANKGIPTVMATITLFDPQTGFPVAIIDGTYITGMRTGAAGAVATKYLSREDSKAAAFIGTGVQARTQLQGLMVVRPSISRIIAYDIDAKNLDNFVQYVKAEYPVIVDRAASVQETSANADIITTTTPARSPVVMFGYVHKGTHINAIGADAPGKQELDFEILKNSLVVVDNWEQASHGGEINVAISKGIIGRADIFADIGEIVTGKKSARQSPDTITVFDSTGLAIQDIYCACEIYTALVSNKKYETQLEKVTFFD
jgi:alanine dehydrogenase